jgi:hypothetical protein
MQSGSTGRAAVGLPSRKGLDADRVQEQVQDHLLQLNAIAVNGE